MAFTTTLLTCTLSPTTYRYSRQCKSSSRFHRCLHGQCILLTDRFAETYLAIEQQPLCWASEAKYAFECYRCSPLLA